MKKTIILITLILVALAAGIFLLIRANPVGSPQEVATVSREQPEDDQNCLALCDESCQDFTGTESEQCLEQCAILCETNY